MNGPGGQTEFGAPYRWSGWDAEDCGLVLQVKSDGFFVTVCEYPLLLVGVYIVTEQHCWDSVRNFILTPFGIDELFFT